MIKKINKRMVKPINIGDGYVCILEPLRRRRQQRTDKDVIETDDDDHNTFCRAMEVATVDADGNVIHRAPHYVGDPAVAYVLDDCCHNSNNQDRQVAMTPPIFQVRLCDTDDHHGVLYIFEGVKMTVAAAAVADDGDALFCGTQGLHSLDSNRCHCRG
jgi:hypothetical protein